MAGGTGGATYDRIGRAYSRRRRPDPRLALPIAEALGDACTIVDVGAGAGSYEPAGRAVVGVDISMTMLRQRPSSVGPAVLGRSEALPFSDASFDAAMAVLTVHHWGDRASGYREMRRVARRQVVVTYEPSVHNDQWIVTDYVPEIAALDAGRPGLGVAEVDDALAPAVVHVLPIPADCVDGFIMAYWRRPEAFLDPEVRACTSGFAMLDPGVVDRAMARLAADLGSGAWEDRHGALRAVDSYDCGLRLVVGGEA